MGRADRLPGEGAGWVVPVTEPKGRGLCSAGNEDPPKGFEQLRDRVPHACRQISQAAVWGWDERVGYGAGHTSPFAMDLTVPNPPRLLPGLSFQ